MFFWSDALGTLLATITFSFVLFSPGYVTGFLLNLFGFRSLNLTWRILISLPLAIAISPLVGYLALSFGGMAVARMLVAIALLACLYLVVPLLRPQISTISIAGIIIAAAWCLVCILMVADWQFGSKLYFSDTAYDHEFRVAVIDAISRTGLPPLSPFNSLDGPVVMRYHVFWFALCSIVHKLGFGYWNARDALNASIVWVGFGLMSLVPVSLRFFDGATGSSLQKRSFIGIGLLAVTGLDVIPNLLLFLDHEMPPPDMEWWTRDQITSWPDAVLWVPHHAGALVAGLTGFFLIWHAATQVNSSRSRVLHALAAGVAFASTVGCSIYLGFVFAVVLTCWTLYTLLQSWREHTRLLVIAGAFAAVLSIPNLVEIMHSDQGGGKFIVPGAWISPFSGLGSQFTNPLLRLLLHGTNTAMALAIELGFFGLTALLTLASFYKTKKLRQPDMAALVLAVTSCALCVSIRSATITNNDLGWRGFMVLQFVLLIWATRLLEPQLSRRIHTSRPRYWWAAIALLFVGVCGTTYQMVWLRLEPIVADSSVFENHDVDPEGPRNYSLRLVYAKLDSLLPEGAVVQSNPAAVSDFAWGLYSHRQTAATGVDCTTAMGGSLQTCEKASPELERLFNGSLKDPAEAREIARRYKINAVILADDDDIWELPDTWATKLRPVITTPHAKAFLMD